MTRTERLQPVVEHTDKKEQQALREMAQCQKALDGELALLRQLQDYKREYLQRRESETELFTPLQLQEYNRFLQQLETTISGQQQVVERSRAEFERRQQAWQATRVDAKAMHKVIDKLEREETADQERREQKVQDEFAQRGNPRRRGSSS